ncbi:hypothetical protein ADL12_19655 [Streptomyces regalis]|uniref:Uncharacterized protein n=1 Tax=Streptomyces regalis TaxID=68262 RepID=A0A0X3UT58_9ACTN|nr:hypothetical protein ADL12_19655 [Streptomyces regalis]
MQPKVQKDTQPYQGPCSVSVPLGEWKCFHKHAPGWWPRAFAEPSPEVVARVDQGLRKLLAA